MSLLVDVFPIEFDLEEYPLIAFKLKAPNANDIGGVFASKVRTIENVPCAWGKHQSIVIVPANVSFERINNVLKNCWQIQLKGFNRVLGVEQILDWEADLFSIAAFVAYGIIDWKFENNVKNALNLPQHTLKVGIVDVYRKPHYKPLIVNHSPAIQITVNSPMESNVPLSKYHDPENPNTLINKSGRCKDFVCDVVSYAGTLGSFRERIKMWQPKTYDADVIDDFPDEHPMLTVKSYKGDEYQYPLGVLQVHVEYANLKELGLNDYQVRQITNFQKISPSDRKELIDEIHEITVKLLASKGSYIQFGERYSSIQHRSNFEMMSSFDLDNRLRFAKEQKVISRDTHMIPTLISNGLINVADHLENNTIKVGIVGIASEDKQETDDRYKQLKRLSDKIAKLNIKLESVHKLLRIDSSIPYPQQKNELTDILKWLIREKQPNIILTYLPTEARYERGNVETSLYNTIKRVCIGSGMPSQVIYNDTITKFYDNRAGEIIYSADDNLVLGIIGKTGNIPYVLARELEYTDVVVGLDVSRRRKKKLQGTNSFAALSRVYTNQGALLGYRASTNTTIVEGEEIPKSVLEIILPKDEFGGKRVVVHRDGKFVDEELKNIREWGEEIGATFYPIEVTKSGSPRLYEDKNGSIEQAPKWSTFMPIGNVAYVASSPPPRGRKGSFSTSMPLRINNYSDLPMQKAIHSVMALTLLHYGSTRATRLPVSIHASDKIAGFISKNITPDKSVGNIPFWL